MLTVGRNIMADTTMSDRKNLKVRPETFEELIADKPDGVTWDYYLTEIRTVDNE